MSLDQKSLTNEYETHSSLVKTYLTDLEEIITKSGEPLEGNSFYYDRTLQLFPGLYNKQLNLFWCGKQATKICEIGFNAGHSAMLLLLGRHTNPLDFTIFDIGTHRYVRPCLSYIESKFPHVNFKFIEGDSTKTMPTWIRENQSSLESYDLIHVDGGHSEDCIYNDMTNANLLLKHGGMMIVDDTHVRHINSWVNRFITDRGYRLIRLLNTQGYTHTVIQKIKPGYQPSLRLKLQRLR